MKDKGYLKSLSLEEIYKIHTKIDPDMLYSVLWEKHLFAYDNYQEDNIQMKQTYQNILKILKEYDK